MGASELGEVPVGTSLGERGRLPLGGIAGLSWDTARGARRSLSCLWSRSLQQERASPAVVGGRRLAQRLQAQPRRVQASRARSR